MSKKKGKKRKQDWLKEPRPWDAKNSHVHGSARSKPAPKFTRTGQKRGG